MGETPTPRFTAGPWKVDQGIDDDDTRWYVTADGPKEWLVATIENGAPGDSLETEAGTARLIASAPDLYAACRKFVDSFKSLQREKCDVAHRMALAALSKAEGREP